MVSINTIAILFLFGAIAIGGAFAFSRISGFFRNFQFPSLGDINVNIPAPFVGPERQDVPFGETGRTIDIVPDVTGGRAERLEGLPDQPLSISDFINRFLPSAEPEPSALIVPELGRVDPRRPTPEDEITPIPVVSLLPTEQVFTGGGVSFEGGTIRENPIDTLSEVLATFPQLSASQAADFLSQFSGILPSELGGIDPDIRNISGQLSEPISLLPASGGFSGVTPEEIFRRLVGGNISNF